MVALLSVSCLIKKEEDRGTSLYGAERGNEWAAKSNRAEGLILASRRRECPHCLENSTPEGGKMQLQKRCWKQRKAKMIADQMAADKRGKVPARPEAIKKFSSQKASIKIICDEASIHDTWSSFLLCNVLAVSAAEDQQLCEARCAKNLTWTRTRKEEVGQSVHSQTELAQHNSATLLCSTSTANIQSVLKVHRLHRTRWAKASDN